MRSKMSGKDAKRFGFIFWFIFLIGGGYYLIRDVYLIAQKSKCSVSVTATAEAPTVIVSETGSGKKKRKHTYYKPNFRYSYDGKPYEAAYEFSNDRNLYPAGTSVELKVDPDNPTVFYVVGDPAAKNDLLEHGIFFLLFSALPVALYYWVPRSKLLHKEISFGQANTEAVRMARMKFEMDEAQRQAARTQYIAEKRRMADQLWEEQTNPQPIREASGQQGEPNKGEESTL